MFGACFGFVGRVIMSCERGLCVVALFSGVARVFSANKELCFSEEIVG